MTPDSVKRPPNSFFANRSKVAWPSDEEIIALLGMKPAYRVARELCCSHSHLINWCKKRGIAMRGRGYWTKITYGLQPDAGDKYPEKAYTGPTLDIYSLGAESESNQIAPDGQSDGAVRFENDDEPPYTLD